MLALAREFIARRDHAVDLVVACAADRLCADIPAGVRVVDLGSWCRWVPGLRRHRGLWVPASTSALARYLQRERPEVMLSTSNPANLAALWSRRMSGAATATAISVNVQLSDAVAGLPRPWGRIFHDLIRRSYPNADALIAISDGVADDLARLTGIDRERIVRIYNPVNALAVQEGAREAVDHPWLWRTGAPVVLAAGKLKPQKDFATLLRAFAHLRKVSAARLIILGEGEERGRLLALAARLGIREDIDLPGYVRNPFAWMARAAVFVLSSAWEGFSNVLAEALACGCPVVSTDCRSGPRELLAGGAYGPLVPVGDDRALAAAIVSSLKMPPDRERLRSRAAMFATGAAAASYLEVLQSALDRTLQGVPQTRRWENAA